MKFSYMQARFSVLCMSTVMCSLPMAALPAVIPDQSLAPQSAFREGEGKNYETIMKLKKLLKEAPRTRISDVTKSKSYSVREAINIVQSSPDDPFGYPIQYELESARGKWTLMPQLTAAAKSSKIESAKKIPRIENYSFSEVVHDGYDWTKVLRSNNKSPTVFHGTSSSLLKSILQNGLDPKHSPISLADERLYTRLRNKYETTSFKGLLGKEKTLSLTLSMKIAKNHARKGPEFLVRRFLGPLKRWLARPEIKGKDRQDILRLHEKYEGLIKNHEPVVLIIQTPLGPDNEIVGPGNDLFLDQKLLDKALEAAAGKLPPVYTDMYATLDGIRKNFPALSPVNIIEAYVRLENYAVHKEKVRPEDIIGVMRVSGGDERIEPIISPHLVDISL